MSDPENAGRGIVGTGIEKTFKTRGQVVGRAEVKALRGVDFEIPRGGAVSFIGESGCGKTTLGRIVAGLESFDSGDIIVDGVAMSSLSRRKQQPYFRKVQMIHQDPYSALNPTRTIHQALNDPLKVRARQLDESREWTHRRAEELLGLVDLDPDYVLPRYPHQLSGGMRQRVVIARALTMDPELLVADEAVSMIDVSLRLGILDLLKDLRQRLGVSLLYITHDLATARYIGEDSQMAVIYRGQVIERGQTDEVISHPVHPYTQSLISAIPVLHGLEEPGPDAVRPSGTLDAEAGDDGCLFASRCPFRTAECEASRPILGEAAGEEHQHPGRHVHACFHPSPRRVAAVSAH